MQGNRGNPGRRRLLIVAAVSLAAHAVALPAAYHLLFAARGTGAVLPSLDASAEAEKAAEAPPEAPILEPSVPLTSVQAAPLPSPPDLPLHWAPPPPAPLDVHPSPARRLERKPDSGMHRSSPGTPDSARGSSRVEEGRGADLDDEAAEEGSGGNGDSGAPPGTDSGEGATASASSGAIEPPAGGQWPEVPPPSLVASLPPGGLRTRPLDPELDADSRTRMVQRVYSLSRYPREALDAESEGTVTVRFRIDRDGRACDIEAFPTAEDLHPSLAEEAVRMVREGAPYPLPALRSEVDLFVAVAWRNTEQAKGDRVVVVVPSGSAAVDEAAHALALAEARGQDELGWHLSTWSLKAIADTPVRSQGSGVRIVSFEGDERLRPPLEKAVAARLDVPDKTGYLKIPIRFRIQPN